MAVSASVQHIYWNDIPVEAVNPVFERQCVFGEHITVARVRLKKGCIIPLHSHFNEQITHIESGSVQCKINGEEVTVTSGQSLVIPPNVPHGTTALEDTVYMDIFSPPREDWIDRSDRYLRGAQSQD